MIKSNLIDLLKTFGYPVKLQGTLTKEEAYPESFFTIWNNETLDGNHYDNEPIGYIWDFTIYFYSTDPALVNTKIVDAKNLLKQNGWVVAGKGYDVPSDEPTHTGRAIDVLYKENN